MKYVFTAVIRLKAVACLVFLMGASDVIAGHCYDPSVCNETSSCNTACSMGGPEDHYCGNTGNCSSGCPVKCTDPSIPCDAYCVDDYMNNGTNNYEFYDCGEWIIEKGYFYDDDEYTCGHCEAMSKRGPTGS